MEIISFINEYAFGVGAPVLLMLTGLFFCLRLRGFYFLHPIRTSRALFGERSGGRASSLRALSLALAGTLGVGNLVGVASAIALGGVGAIFWMWVSAMVAMVLKYAEIVLAVRHRRFDSDGRPHGAAAYYIRDLFGKSGWGTVLSALFALLCLLNALSMGGMIQINAAAEAVEGVFGLPRITVGIAFALIALYAMLRGAEGIMRATERLVPFMTVGFVIISLWVIFSDPSGAYAAVKSIISEAFSMRSGVGGAVGFLTSDALRYGTMRGILSNEAGCGTAPTAHATAECDMPARQGLWGIVEVFVDTVVLCTLTAVVIIMSGGASDDYMMMTVNAYSAALGEYAGVFIALSVVLFGLATVLCWGHYGMESAELLAKGRRGAVAFIPVYCVCVAFGAVLSGEYVWELADLAIGGMTVINLCVLFCMRGEVREETDRLFPRRR